MYGSNFANNSEIIVDSFQKTSHAYEERRGYNKYNLLLKPYIKLFGIPEIGFQLRTKYFLQTLKGIRRFKPKKILDAGSGIGFYSFLLADTYPKAEIQGVDMDEEKLQFCKQYSKEHKLKNTTFQKANLEKFAKKRGTYDLIVNIDVLEHITNYRKVLKNFYSSLKPGGYLYIHTPQNKQQRLFKSFFRNWHHEDHVREGFDPEKLKQDLLKIGFTSVEYKEGFGWWGKLSWELYHITLAKSFALAGIIYPLTYLLSRLDNGTKSDGLTVIVLAKK